MAYEQILPISPRGPATDQWSPAKQIDVPGFTTFNFRMPMADADVADVRNHVGFRFVIARSNLPDRDPGWKDWIGTAAQPIDWDGGPDAVDRQGNPAPPNVTGAQLGSTPATQGTWFLKVVYSIARRVGVGLEWEVAPG